MFTVADLRQAIEVTINGRTDAVSLRNGVEFIYEALTAAYNEGLSYDISDMYWSVVEYATLNLRDRHNIELLNKMHFRSKNVEVLDPMRSSRRASMRNDAACGRISHGKSCCSELKYI